MPAKSKDHTNPAFADRIVKALPAKLRDGAEVVSKEGKPYSVVKLNGRSVASVRDGAIRIVHPHDGSAEAAKALAKMLADAAPEPKPEPKAKEPTGGEEGSE